MDAHDRAALDLRKTFPTWALERPINGVAGSRFTRWHLCELHRAELTYDLRRDQAVIDGALPFPANQLVLDLGIPTGDTLILGRSVNADLKTATFHPDERVFWQSPFAAELLRRAAALGVPSDVPGRIRREVVPPDPVDTWRRRIRLEVALYSGVDMRSDWKALQNEVLAAYGLLNHPAGKRRNVGRLLPDLDQATAKDLCDEGEMLAEFLRSANESQVTDAIRLRYPCFSRAELQAVLSDLKRSKSAGRNAVARRLGISKTQLSELTRQPRRNQ